MSSTSLQPTWFGYVNSARDALILFEACLQGTLHHVARRPHDRERSQLIKSGYVFIYEENASGIKRWTDGVPWSPSRILGNFLVYRELEKPFPPGEKKRATKRNKRPTRPGEPYARPDAQSPTSPTTPTSRNSDGDIRNLIGSLVDSYGFKDEGLVKKTMSVNVHGVHHHLVSYYKVEDVQNGTLKQPGQDNRLLNIEPRADLVARQNFRAPIDETSDEHDGMNGGNAYGGYAGGYDARGPLMHSQYPPGYGSVGAMPMYPAGMGYSSSGYTPNMPSFAPMNNAQNYYSAQQPPQAHPQIDNRDNRQSLPQPNYYSRSQNMTPTSLGPLSPANHSNVKLEYSNVKLEDSNNMSRPPNGAYAPTAAGSYPNNTSQSSLQSPTYPSSNGYSYPTSSQQNLPSVSNGYVAHDSSQNYMGMQGPLGQPSNLGAPGNPGLPGNLAALGNLGAGPRPPYNGQNQNHQSHQNHQNHQNHQDHQDHQDHQNHQQ